MLCKAIYKPIAYLLNVCLSKFGQSGPIHYTYKQKSDSGYLAYPDLTAVKHIAIWKCNVLNIRNIACIA